MSYFNTHGKVKYSNMGKDSGTAIVTLDKANDADKLARRCYEYCSDSDVNMSREKLFDFALTMT